MSRHILISVSAIACFVVVASIGVIAQSPQTNGRFQLVTAEVGSPQPQPTVFLLDTATGQVWKYDIHVGAMHQLKKQDRGESASGTVSAVSSGSFIPIPRIEYVKDLDSGKPPSTEGSK
jgi:hypothetical protein